MKYIYIYDNEIINTNKNKYIYDDYEKFGYQIFNLIYAIYLYNLYNTNDNKCKIYYVFNKLNNIPLISNIFTNIKSKINFILYNNHNNHNNHNNNSNNSNNNDNNDNDNIINILNLNDFPDYINLNNYSKFNNTYNLTYQMYYTFDQNDKNIFLKLNEKLIIDTDKILFKLNNTSYSVINIIYGNKLSYLNKYNNNEIIVNSPIYYLNMILSKLSSNNIFVILTDSEDIVKQYISSKYKNKKIIIINNDNVINNLYLHLYANEIILEISPLCFAGAYFNQKATCYLNVIKRNENSVNNLIELSLSEHWNLSYDKNNILNYDNYTIKKLFKLFTKKKILYENKQNLELVNNLNFLYKNKINIGYNNYFFRLIEKKNNL